MGWAINGAPLMCPRDPSGEGDERRRYVDRDDAIE
jgi:hypothetical protein